MTEHSNLPNSTSSARAHSCEKALRAAGWDGEIIPPGPTGEYGTRIVGADGSTISIWPDARGWAAEIRGFSFEDGEGYRAWRSGGDLPSVARSVVARARRVHPANDPTTYLGVTLTLGEDIEAFEIESGRPISRLTRIAAGREITVERQVSPGPNGLFGWEDLHENWMPSEVAAGRPVDVETVFTALREDSRDPGPFRYVTLNLPQIAESEYPPPGWVAS